MTRRLGDYGKNKSRWAALKIYVVNEILYDEGMTPNSSLATDSLSAAIEKRDSIAKKRGIFGVYKYKSNNPEIDVWEDGKVIERIKLSKIDSDRLGLKESK